MNIRLQTNPFMMKSLMCGRKSRIFLKLQRNNMSFPEVLIHRNKALGISFGKNYITEKLESFIQIVTGLNN